MQWIENIVDADKQLLLLINRFHTPFWDHVMVMISDLIYWLPLYVIVVYFIFRNFRMKGFLILIFLILLIIISSELSFQIKQSFHRLRPCNNPRLEGQLHILNKGGIFGFVSTHAANSCAAFTYIFLIFRSRIFFYTMLVWCLTVSYSRIYMGVHYPLDILGGMMLGISLGLLVYIMTALAWRYVFVSSPPIRKYTRLQFRQALIIAAVFLFLLALFMGISLVNMWFSL